MRREKSPSPLMSYGSFAPPDLPASCQNLPKKKGPRRTWPLSHCLNKAPVGIEPTNGGFADLCLTTWLRRRGTTKLPGRASPPQVVPAERFVSSCAEQPGARNGSHHRCGTAKARDGGNAKARKQPPGRRQPPR